MIYNPHDKKYYPINSPKGQKTLIKYLKVLKNKKSNRSNIYVKIKNDKSGRMVLVHGGKGKSILRCLT